jgi:proteic killer suppression protein
MAIQSFRDNLTEKIFFGVKDKETSKFPPDVLGIVQRKLDMIKAAARIQDLVSPPANRLEKLKGDRQGFWSIRINDQWRIIFKWLDDGPHDVQIIDYH